MSDDPTGTSSLPSPPVRERERPTDPVSDAALQRYRQRQRRPRLIYAGVVTVVVLLLGIVTVVAWSSGESNNSTLRTVADPPANLAIATPAASVSKKWETADRAAIGTPLWRGTVVTFGEHGVQGVDARSGDTTWSYRRSDRTVCTAAQLAGVTVAVFKLRGNCDQVAGLDSQTGERRWSRTLNMDGMPVSGEPSFEASTQYGSTTLLVRTSSVVYALDPASGYNRWTYTRYGCEITGATVGTAGGLISQKCSNAVRCGSLKFCGAGNQLFLLPNGFSRDDGMKDTNPDHIIWNLIGTGARPVSADSLVSAIAAGTLLHLNSRNGKTTARTPLAAEPDDATVVRATDLDGTEIVSIGEYTYGLRNGVAAPVWTRDGRGPATVVSPSPPDPPVPTTARITLLTAGGAATLDATTGRVTGTVPLSGAPATGSVYPLAAGFLAAGATATDAYA